LKERFEEGMVRKYDYIPLIKLRRMYKNRRGLKRILAELAIGLVFAAIYGLTTGLMIMGLWLEF
jgi:hypothetical protein